MLEISNHSIKDHIETSQWKSFSATRKLMKHQQLQRTMLIVFLAVLASLFLPWTQNIRSRGYLTPLRPDQRPTSIHSVIAGRIEAWYVREGQLLAMGDTIMRISEVKDEFFNPAIMTNLQEQLSAKLQSVASYRQKMQALDNQIAALQSNLAGEIRQQEQSIAQATLVVQSENAALDAARVNAQIAQEQYARFEKLYGSGLKSKTELEQRELAMQQAAARLVEAENKLAIAQAALMNAKTELLNINTAANEKIAKARSDWFAAQAAAFEAETQATQMQNKLAAYEIRADFYYITAPIDGYITRAVKYGVGQVLSEGEEIATLMPARAEMAVELYVEPMNMPLIETGQRVRFIFDGWPAFVFSGWPGVSFGTYGGRITAIDNFVSPNGLYRVLVTPDPEDVPWPSELRTGAGANGFALLNTVPVWYELWRQFNGFPPDFYHLNNSAEPPHNVEP